jgi:capsular polysaccharide transport system permease protein
MTVEARSTPTSQALTLIARARLLPEPLRRMAGVAREADLRPASRSLRGRRRRDVMMPVLFVGLFVLPASIGTLIDGFYLSDRYVTEVSFAIRPALGASLTSHGGGGKGGGKGGGEESGGGGGGGAAGLVGQMVSQDTQIVAEYVTSRQMVEAIGKQLPLRQMFSRDDIDLFSRFDPELPIEKLVRYWRERVEVRIEGTASIIQVSVNAFDPQESLALAKAILAESERKVNEQSGRMRQEALAESERELKRAGDRLLELQVATRDARNQGGVLDGQKTGEANLKMVSEVRAQRIALDVQLKLLQRDLRDDARSIKDLKAQIAQLDDTIARLEREATSQDSGQRRVLSDALTRFERLDAERKDAQTFYGTVIGARELARMVADRQIEFFSVVVEPTLAQSAQEPRRALLIAVAIGGSAVLFGLGVLLRKHLV